MPFRIKRRESIRKGLERVVRERLNDVLAALDDDLTDPNVHTARRRLKEVRATLRLFRRDLGDDVFKRENRTHRDSARPLSGLRDATALVQCFDALVKHFARRLQFQNVLAIRAFLVERRRAQRAEALRERASFRRIARQTRRARKRVKTWPLSNCRKRNIAQGLRTVYRDGRRAMRIANTLPTDDALHEWRKRTKDLRYAMELLQCHARDRSDAISLRAHELTNLLGDDHDLATLRTVVKGQNVAGAYQVIALIDERRTELQRESTALGRTLYRDKPRRFVRCVLGRSE